MRSGAAAVQNTLSLPAQQVLRQAISAARERGHAQVQPFHVAFVLLAHGDPVLRQACADTHSQTLHGLHQCHALELCFNVALDRLQQCSSSGSTVNLLGLSNALVAALKRAQAQQKRGCPDQQQAPLVMKVELEMVIISILEDPSVSRVMEEAGFFSQQVKTNIENAMSLSALSQQSNVNHLSQRLSASAGPFGNQPLVILERPLFPTREDSNSRSSEGNAPTQELKLPFCSNAGASLPISSLVSTTPGSTEVPKLICCSECTDHFNMEYNQIRVQESAKASTVRKQSSTEDEVVVSSLPSWLQKGKDMKTEQERHHSLSQRIQELRRKWQFVCSNSHSERCITMDSSPARDRGLGPPSHNWMKASILNNANNSVLMAANPTPLQSKDMALSSALQPSLPSPLPFWDSGFTSVAMPNGPLNGIIGTSGSELSRVETMEKQVESFHDKEEVLQQGGQISPEYMGPVPSPRPVSKPITSLPSGGLVPIQNPLSKANASLSSTRPSPLSRLKASFPKPSVAACPLKENILPKPSPLSALKTSNVSPNPASMVKSPPSLAQKIADKPPLSQLVDISAKIDQHSVFFDHKTADRLKYVHKGLMEKVVWQGKAISTISTFIVNAQTGRGELRGGAAKAGTWLLLLGPDQVGKRLIAGALAELVVGVAAKPIYFGDLGYSRWGRKVEEIDGMQYRGRTAVDSIADALRAKPLSVLLLEDIDQAVSVIRTKLMRAMVTGKFSDSNGGHVSVGNSIIIMTSRLGANSNLGKGKENIFSEGRLASMHGARMSLLLQPPREKEIVLQGDMDISVVRDTIRTSALENPANPMSGGMVLKRKASGFLSRALLGVKRKKVSTPFGRIVALDLNLSAEENEAVLAETVTSHEEIATNIGVSDPVLRAVQEVLSPKFCSLVDETVMFEPFDLMGLANWILLQLSRACSGLVPKFCTRIEVDFQILEHIVSTTWRTPGGRQAFEGWVEDKLKSCLKAVTANSSVSEDRVLRFAYEGCFSKELCLGSELPLQIEVACS